MVFCSLAAALWKCWRKGRACLCFAENRVSCKSMLSSHLSHKLPGKRGTAGSWDNDKELCILSKGGSSEGQLPGLSTMPDCPANPPKSYSVGGGGGGREAGRQNRKQSKVEARAVAVDSKSQRFYLNGGGAGAAWQGTGRYKKPVCL